MAQVEKQFGRLDGVFPNAGIKSVWAPLEELTYDEWNETMCINLGGRWQVSGDLEPNPVGGFVEP